MRYIGPFVLGSTVCAALLVLAVSIWPGAFADLAFDLIVLFPLGCMLLLAGACGALGILLQLTYDMLAPGSWRHRLWGASSIIVGLVTIGLLWFDVPLRAVFVVYRSEFQALADAPPPAHGSRRWNLQRRIGPYYVDVYGVDRTGAIYFRTHTGPDGIGPDSMEYGFAYRPVRDGVPLGRTRHRIQHLCGDWYTFEGSDD